MIFGLGNRKVYDAVITWPDRSELRIDHPTSDKNYFIRQTDTGIVSSNKISIEPPVLYSQSLFKEEAQQFDKHTEDSLFVDYYVERNIPIMLSREGPKAAVADVNKDGMQDIFIGGAKGQAGQLYIQSKNGFIKKSQVAFEEDKNFEDVAVLFFDCDQDGDDDLFVGAGGNDLPPRNPYLKHRLYKNDGHGSFKKDTSAFGGNNSNISVAVADDYDNDGDLDLFVGGRSLSYNYGVDPQSFIYENDGKGHFKDVTGDLNPAIASIGMVTSATWADVNGIKKTT